MAEKSKRVSLEILPEFSEKQLAVLDVALDPETRHLLLGGSVGAGKTSLMCVAWYLSIVMGRGNVEGGLSENGATLFVGRTMDAAYDNIVSVFSNEEVFGEMANSVQVPRGKTSFEIFGETIILASGNDARAADKLRGRNLKAAIIDEVATMDKDFFNQIVQRLRVGSHTKLFATFNPKHPRHWLKLEYIDKVYPGSELYDENGWRHIRMWMDDNPGLTERYKSNLRSTLTGKDYDRDVAGEWAADAGRVYYMFDNNKHVVAHEKMPEIAKVLSVGIDYGETAPSAAIMLGLTTEPRRLVVLDEFYYAPKNRQDGLAPSQLSTRIAHWVAEDHIPRVARHWELDSKPRAVLVDPGGGGPSLAREMDMDPAFRDYRRALRYANKGNGSVADGVSMLKMLFSEEGILISDRCKNLIAEFDLYSIDTEKSDARGETVFNKGNDHCCDALRYAVYETYGLWNNYIRTAWKSRELKEDRDYATD